MRSSRSWATALVALLACPPAQLLAAEARVEGKLRTPQGAPVAAPANLVNLTTGESVPVQADSGGTFTARVAPGLYGLDVPGYASPQGPLLVSASSGGTAALAAVVEPRAGGAPRLEVKHDAPGCFDARRTSEVDAVVHPARAGTSARVYFRDDPDADYHYVEMVPDVGRWLACLPEPAEGAERLSYYIEVEGPEGRSRTPEVDSLVVAEDSDCPAPKRRAPLCVCPGPVAVFMVDGTPVGGIAGGLIAGAIGTVVTAAGIVAGTGIRVDESGGTSGPVVPASPSR